MLISKPPPTKRSFSQKESQVISPEEVQPRAKRVEDLKNLKSCDINGMSWKFSDALAPTAATSRTFMWTAKFLKFDQGFESSPLDTRTQKTIPIDEKQSQWGHDSRHAFYWLSFSPSRGLIERWNCLYSNPTVPCGKTINFLQCQNFGQSWTENVYHPQSTLRNSFSFTNLWTLCYWILISDRLLLWSETDSSVLGT